jgi:hypothetical protein
MHGIAGARCPRFAAVFLDANLGSLYAVSDVSSNPGNPISSPSVVTADKPILFGWRERTTRFLDSEGSSAFADDPAALEMTMGSA